MGLGRSLTPPSLGKPSAVVAVVEDAAVQPTLLVPLAARAVFMAAAVAVAEELQSLVKIFIAQGPTAQVAQSASFTPAASVYSPQQTQGTCKWQLFQASSLR